MTLEPRSFKCKLGFPELSSTRVVQTHAQVFQEEHPPSLQTGSAVFLLFPERVEYFVVASFISGDFAY